MVKNSIDYYRLEKLNELLNSGIASKDDKKEYVDLLYKEGSISKKQHSEYIKGENVDDILKAALAIGAITLLGYAVIKLLGD